MRTAASTRALAAVAWPSPRPWGWATASSSRPTGRSSSLSWDFAITRFDNAGAVDQTWGEGGTVPVAPLASTDGRAISTSDIAVQPDGKVVALGYVSRYYEGLPPQVVMVRLTSDGALDEEFGDVGVVEVDTFGMPNALVVQPDGILVAGRRVVAWG